MKRIGFIGVGIMGKSMVRNLMKAGYELHIYARNKAKVEDVIELDMLGPRIIADDYTPGFFLKHFVKDMRLALMKYYE